MFKNNNKIKVMLIFFIVFLLSFLTTISSYSEAQDKYTMKIAYPFGITADHPHYRIGNYIKERIENLTEGKIKVQLFPQSQLGGDRETIEGVMNGLIEMNWPASAPIALIVPEIGVLDLPYIFKDVDHAFRVLDSHVGDELAEKCLSKGIRIGGWGLSGFRHVMTTKKPINSLEDIKGLKIRVMESPSFLEMIKAWGAIPTPIAWTEVYMALAQGVVDGQETVINAAMDENHLEPIRYIALTYDSITIRPLIISEIWFQTLPTNLQESVLEATEEATAMMREEILKFEEAGVEKAKTVFGVTITEPDLAPWIKATRAIYPKLADLVGGQEIIDESLAIE